jgi:hypothetical protein
MKNRQKNRRLALFVASLIIGAMQIAFWDNPVARGASSPPNLREQHEKEIASKSEPERARLQRKFKEFRELPAAEREKLREFDRLLKEDARNGGNLRTVLNEYNDWLATLTPGQAQDLREIDDPGRRESRVREILKEQQDQADATDPAKAGKSPPKLNSKDLAAVLDVIEQAMRKRQLLTQDELKQLDSKKDLAHKVYVVELAFRRQPGQQGPLQWISKWMSKEVMADMLENISNARFVKLIQQSQLPGERWQRLFRAVFAAVRAEYDALKPSQQDLELFFVQLKPTEQDEIMRLPFDQQHAQLMHTFIVKKSEEDPDAYPKPPQVPLWLMRSPGAGRAGMGRGGGDAAGTKRQPGAVKKGNQKDRKEAKPKADAE